MSKRSARRRAAELRNAERRPAASAAGTVTKIYAIDRTWRPDHAEAASAAASVHGLAAPRPEDTPRYVKNITARTPGQTELLQAIDTYGLVAALGPAGTGKTFLAVAKAVEALDAGHVNRIILSRPAIEAGESIGFLPGAMEDKLAPYLRPLYDALQERMSAKKLKTLLAEGIIEIAPVGYMRGRTLNNAFVVVDEAQNCSYTQLKMLLTRMGWHSTMVITGDPQQSDLAEGLSGLALVSERLAHVDGAAVVRLDKGDIVRHPLVAQVLDVL